MKYSKNNFRNLLVSSLLIVLCSLFIGEKAEAQIWRVWLKVNAQQIYGPKSTKNAELWQIKIKQWREIEKAKLAYNDAYYTSQNFQWVQQNFIQPQMMAQERTFYDPIKNEYTVDKFLAEVAARYRGLNSILIWPTYSKGL